MTTMIVIVPVVEVVVVVIVVIVVVIVIVAAAGVLVMCTNRSWMLFKGWVLDIGRGLLFEILWYICICRKGIDSLLVTVYLTSSLR